MGPLGGRWASEGSKRSARRRPGSQKGSRNERKEGNGGKKSGPPEVEKEVLILIPKENQIMK